MPVINRDHRDPYQFQIKGMIRTLGVPMCPYQFQKGDDTDPRDRDPYQIQRGDNGDPRDRYQLHGNDMDPRDPHPFQGDDMDPRDPPQFSNRE